MGHLYHTDYRHLGVSVIIHFIIITAAVILLPDESLSAGIDMQGDREREITVYLTKGMKSIKSSHGEYEILQRTESAVKAEAAGETKSPEAALSQSAAEASASLSHGAEASVPADKEGKEGRENFSGSVNNNGEKADSSIPQYVKAMARDKIKISYPVSAARRNIEGSVTVEILVDETGKISNAQVVSSSGYSILDKAAIEAVMQAGFIPAQLGGRKVSDTLKILIDYKLTQDHL